VRSFVYSRATALRSGYRDGSAFVASYRIAPEDYNAFLDYTSTNLADDRTSAATWRSRLDLERLELDALLRGRIAGRVFDRESSLRLYNVRDRTLEEAMRHWPEATAMAR